jgi:hypothetical protein
LINIFGTHSAFPISELPDLLIVIRTVRVSIIIDVNGGTRLRLV